MNYIVTVFCLCFIILQYGPWIMAPEIFLSRRGIYGTLEHFVGPMTSHLEKWLSKK